MPDHTYHPEAPTDSEGFPVHPDPGKSYRICARPKSDRTTPNGQEHEAPFCTLTAGWGCDEDRGAGQACKHHGGKSGAPEGPRNGSWKLGLYSDFLTEDDADRAEEWLEFSDGDRLHIDDFTRMAEKAMLFEFTRIERAMVIAPDPSVSEKFCCKYCGTQIASREVLVCPNCETTLHPEDIPTTAEWVDMHDRQISERIERWVDMLKTYKETVEGSDLNVNLGVTFEDAIRRAEELRDSDAAEKVEYLHGE